jgi:nitrous oxidase accessory protein NosD/nitrous oxide reductase accessory protein NosL
MANVVYVGGALILVVLMSATAFGLAPATDAGLEPVDFRDTVATGLTGVDVSQARHAGYVIPQGQVFYSQYRYVVGYYGIATLTSGLETAERSGQFGQPLAIFVTDFSDTEPTLTSEGFVTLTNSIARGWVRAPEAAYVVGSRARTPGGPAVLAFSDSDDARRFADTHGGEVRTWDAVRERFASGTSEPGPRFGTLVRNRTTRADQAVSAARELRDRPVSLTVGESVDTIAEAVTAAPPNTTIRIPPGHYDVNLTVTKPVTIRGAGSKTVLDGSGTGSLLTVRSPRVAVTDLAMTGIGSRRTGSAGNASGETWDERIRLIYGQGNAAIRLADAHGSLVSGIHVETPANGIVVFNSTGVAVRNVTVRGSDTWREGFMNILAMYSDPVVEDSTLIGGRDAVYTHYAHGVVIRNNTMRDARFGVHEMFTSDALVANNTVRGMLVGLIVMTRPSGNVIAWNDVRNSEVGISVVGSASYAVGNVLASNGAGLSIGTARSYYARNTIVDNGVGIRDETLLPTNDVTENDVVDNAEYVDMGGGPRVVWAHRGQGNYWGAVPGRDRDGDGIVDRPFRPSDPVDIGAVSAVGPNALSRSPAVISLRGFQSAVPGLRGSSLVDPAPLAEPVRPTILSNETQEDMD